jgi:acyl-CoA thioester hydrolase
VQPDLEAPRGAARSRENPMAATAGTGVCGVSTVRVRYAETDQMGVAWHGYYLAWFEVGRTDLLRHQGVTYKELEAGGLRLPVTRTQMTFLRPALYDDLLEIRTEVAEVRGARMRFDYEVHREGTPGPLATPAAAV